MECLNGNDPKINCYVCLVPLKLSLQYARKKIIIKLFGLSLKINLNNISKQLFPKIDSCFISGHPYSKRTDMGSPFWIG